ncbi:MAG: hypothetical protein WA021_03695 [Minisyncoccia bacterium]
MIRIGALLSLLVFVMPFFVHAADMELTPFVIDEKAKARDIIKKELTIRNTSNRKLNLYPGVNDVNPEDGKIVFVSAVSGEDREASLANWIELSRGVVELSPGEEKTMPFTIRVNMTALPGVYHAAISFSEGSTRTSAEQNGELVTLMVNVEILADIKESLQLNKFATDNFFLSGDDVLFDYQLENTGNQALQPKGEIRIYDRRGEEIAAVEVNGDGKLVAPEEVAQLASVWSAVQGFGKYKAMLNVEYGESQLASVQDTVFFWVVPWKQLALMLTVTLIAVIIFALYFHRWLEERHMQKFALAAGIPMPQPPPPQDPSVHRPGFFGRLAAKIAPRKSPLMTMAQTAPPVAHVAPAPPPAAPAPAAPVVPHATELTPAPERPTLKEALERSPTPHLDSYTGNVIDLKQRHEAIRKSEVPQSSVINLKKRS